MCRMLIAVGEVNTTWLIDDFILMASGKNERHENNADKLFQHGDGWGMCYFDRDQLKIHKSIKPCYEDGEIHSYKKISSPLIIMHARHGSKGKVKIENVHPFHYLNYIFLHNGTVKEKLKYNSMFIPQGNTDSEELFYYLLSDITGELNEHIIYKKLSQVKNFTGMNMIISNGEISFVINWYAVKPNYYKLKMLKTKDFVVISSEILPHFKQGTWRTLNNKDILKIYTKKIRRKKNES